MVNDVMYELKNKGFMMLLEYWNEKMNLKECVLISGWWKIGNVICVKWI
jgi:hypothetical protein